MKRHAQPRSKTPRVPSSAALLPELSRALHREASEYGVSLSWVSAIAHAKHLGIRIPPEADYRNEPWKKGGRS